MLSSLVRFQTVLVFVFDPAVADMLQVEVRIPIRSMSVVFAGTLSIVVGSANPRGDPLFFFLLFFRLPFVLSSPPGSLEKCPFPSEVGGPFHAQILVG